VVIYICSFLFVVPVEGLCSTSHFPVNLPASEMGDYVCEKFTCRIGCYLAPMPLENPSEKRKSLLLRFQALIVHSLGTVFWWSFPMQWLLLPQEGTFVFSATHISHHVRASWNRAFRLRWSCPVQVWTLDLAVCVVLSGRSMRFHLDLSIPAEREVTMRFR